ncbi:MAG: insulinase family protein [Clostridia bacterium]|nr:insulinase family protein [Clostridia bacterium]
MADIKTLYPAKGVKLCLIPTEQFKTSIVSAIIAMPLAGRIEERALLSSLLRRASAKYDDLTKMNRKLAGLYGAVLSSGVDKIGEGQFVSFSVSSVDDRFAIDGERISSECIELLLEILFEPKLCDGVFSAEDVETEKRLFAEKIDSEFSDKKLYSLEAMIEKMCEDEVYSVKRYGSKEKLLSLTPEDVTAAWREMLASAMIQFNVVGNCDGGDIAQNLRERFEKVDRSNPCEIRTQIISECDGEKYFSESQSVKQGKLVIGMRSGMKDKDDDYYAFKVMTDMFGGGPYSKLFMNVREKMSLCYYCGARLNRAKGIIVVQSGIEQENEQKAVAAIRQQLEDMKNGVFTDEDIENSIKGISDMVLSANDLPDTINAWYSGNYTSVEDDEKVSPEEFVENIQKVTASQVKEAAKKVSIDTIFMLKPNGKGVDEDDDED